MFKVSALRYIPKLGAKTRIISKIFPFSAKFFSMNNPYVITTTKWILKILKYAVGEKKDSTLHRAYGEKLPLLRAVWADQDLILPLEK